MLSSGVFFISVFTGALCACSVFRGGGDAEKKMVDQVKFKIMSGKATPAPPIGSALGQRGVNIMDFCNQFNAQTRGQDTLHKVVVSIYEDRTFSFRFLTPPTSFLIKRELGMDKGYSEPYSKEECEEYKEKYVLGSWVVRFYCGELSQQQLEKIARIKMPDLKSQGIEQAKKTVAGTARSMGIFVEGE